MPLRISELAKAGGVGVETVRFYQRKRLLEAPRAPATGGRHYGNDDVRRLRFIRSAQEAGFTLKEIGELLALDRSNDRARAREMAAGRIADLDEKIATLSRARDQLGKLARECARSGKGPCPIIEAFER
jgi:MerR family mercuric resistance operon transcriptional regulator